MLWAASASGEYPVFVGPGLLGAGLRGRWRGRRFCVTDTRGRRRSTPSGSAPLAATVEVEPGEGAKTMAEAERVLRELAQAGMTREDHVVALGGGVVGDLAGFCAHLYQRGVPVVQVPTTLVAQVDSAYGGKTGVDLPEGKNYAGAYHLPAAVLADTATLASLPAEELAAGFVEAAEDRACWPAARSGSGCARSRRSTPASSTTSSSPAPATSARSSPPTSATPACAHVLNLGHTVGHAIEAASGYERYRHGEAVGLGLLAALRLSEAPELRDEVEAILRRHGLPVALDPAIDVDAMLDALQRDKKRTAAGVGFVLLSEPGEPRIGQLVDPARVRAAVEELLPMTTARNRVAVLHGVNFDILERRDPEVYGGLSLSELETQDRAAGRASWASNRSSSRPTPRASSSSTCTALPELADAALVNAGAWTHYSRAIADALDVAGLPAVEVHLSDVE